MKWASGTVTVKPTATPITQDRAASRSTSLRMRPRGSPSAIRTPISRRRRLAS